VTVTLLRSSQRCHLQRGKQDTWHTFFPERQPGPPAGGFGVLLDVLVCSSIVDPGHHLVHELRPGRSAWLHILYGEATLNDIVLIGGDGVGVTNQPSVSLTVEENTEILLVDLCRNESGRNKSDAE